MMNVKWMMLTAALVGCSSDHVPDEARMNSQPEKLSGSALVERGKYLVTTSGCHDCHTPLKMGPNGPEPDFSLELSGHPASLVMPPPPQPVGPWIGAMAATNTAWAGPWGVSFTANLTPDKETGTGNWSKETFVATIRNGKHMGVGRPLLPPMPFPMYKHMTDDDLGAVFAYIQSRPAIKNKVPEPLPPVAPAAAAVEAPPAKVAKQ